jgi:hypothetical protein
MIIRKATCQRSIALIRITPSFRAEMKKQMTDWALAPENVVFANNRWCHG